MKLTRCLMATAAVATLVAACSSSGGSTNPSGGESTAVVAGGSPTAPSSTSAGPPLKVMSFFSSTGVDASTLIPDGAKAAAQAINSDGGINGRMIQADSCDDKNTPAGAKACAQKAIDGGYITVLGSDSLQNGQYLPVLAKGNVSLFGSAPLQLGGDFTAPNSFPLTAGVAAYPAAAGLALEKLGATKISLAAIDIGNNSLDVALNQGLSQNGNKVVNFVQVPAAPPDQAPYVKAALANGTNGILVWQQESDAISFVRQLSSQGATPKVAIVSNDQAHMFDQLGKDGYGVATVFNTYPTNQTQIPAVAKEVKDFKAAGVDDALPDRDADNAYAAVIAFADIVKKMSGDVTPASFMAAIKTTTNLRTGLMPPLQFVTGNKDKIGPSVYNNCSLLTEQSADGMKLISPDWIDPTTGKPCPAP